MKKPPPNTPCGYCFNRWAVVYDHLWPRSARGSNNDSNLYPACTRCNGLLSNKCFDTLQQKRAFVRSTLIKRGCWNETKLSPQGTGVARKAKKKAATIREERARRLYVKYNEGYKPSKRKRLKATPKFTGKVITCGLRTCKIKIKIKQGLEHQRYCCIGHRVRAWFLRTYIKREEVPVGNNLHERQPRA